MEETEHYPYNADREAWQRSDWDQEELFPGIPYNAPELARTTASRLFTTHACNDVDHQHCATCSQPPDHCACYGPAYLNNFTRTSLPFRAIPLRLPCRRPPGSVSSWFSKCDEARRQSAESKEMECSGGGTLAAPAAPLPGHTHTQDSTVSMSMLGRETSGFYQDRAMDTQALHFDHQLPMDTVDFGPQLSGLPEMAMHGARADRIERSNVRGSGQALRAPSASIDAANIAVDDTDWPVPRGWSLPPVPDQYPDPYSVDPHASQQYQEPTPCADDPPVDDSPVDDPPVGEAQPKDMQAFAKLSFPDGDYYVTTVETVLGRDKDYYWRQMRAEALPGRPTADDDAYTRTDQPPGQPDDANDNGEGPSSSSSHSLAYRPAPRCLPSNFSEQGGAVSYAPDEDAETRRGKRSRRFNYKSSSATSVAPASLHASMLDASQPLGAFAAAAAAMTEEPAVVFVPIHPSNPHDIRYISRRHLLFRYNFTNGEWELKVLGGSGALVNNIPYFQNKVVPLDHGDIITLNSVEMEFRLPDSSIRSPGLTHGTFPRDEAEDEADDEVEDENDEMEQPTPVGTSPIRRLSNAIAAADSDEEEEDAAPPKKKSGIKLNLGKKRKVPQEDEMEDVNDVEKPAEKPAKKQKRTEESAERSPEAAKKPDKGKKPVKTANKKPKTANKGPPKAADGEPQTADKEAAETIAVTDENGAKEEKVSPPTQAMNFEPGSIFEGVPIEDLPQKRKGPGRPPKNGLISKRDQSFVKRKQKDYEKRGVQPPPFDQLVAEVRAETKQKEAAAKAAARGEPAPEMPVVESIESDANAAAAPKSDDAMACSMTDPMTSATPAEPARKSSPKPKRVPKSPSPMKAQHEYTVEELKKPTMTYVHILDEILKDHPIGKADLQELYDRICKRYPHFKFNTGTSGWQSSVRHNLLQHGRFKEDGRSGKGRLWAINYSFPLEKEKKRNRTPPQRFPQQMQNGAFPPGQMGPYGAPNFNGPYGQPPPNGTAPPGGPYYSPYGGGPYGHPGGQHGGPPPGGQQAYGTHPSQTPNPQHSHNAYPHQQHRQQRPPASVAPPPRFGVIVEEIMAYRADKLSSFDKDTPMFAFHDEMFRKCTAHLSEIFHGTRADGRPELTVGEKVYYDGLEAIFQRHPEAPLGRTAGGAGQNAAVGAQGAQAGQATAPIDVDASVSGSGAGAGPSVPAQSTLTMRSLAVAQGNAQPAAQVGQTAAPACMVAQAGNSMASTGIANTSYQDVHMAGTAPEMNEAAHVGQTAAVRLADAVPTAEPAAMTTETAVDAELRRQLTG
ncbi:hypothetical protein LTR08_000746 [Meristemomyces frigidus]|nr:hypothetical protein LTR08_000746 [Meristemomyces frigidus]